LEAAVSLVPAALVTYSSAEPPAAPCFTRRETGAELLRAASAGAPA